MTTPKWSVRKRDGIWCAIDDDGDLRHATHTWRSAYTFALLGADRPHPNLIDVSMHPAIIAFRLRWIAWLKEHGWEQ